MSLCISVFMTECFLIMTGIPAEDLLCVSESDETWRVSTRLECYAASYQPVSINSVITVTHLNFTYKALYIYYIENNSEKIKIKIFNFTPRPNNNNINNNNNDNRKIEKQKQQQCFKHLFFT